MKKLLLPLMLLVSVLLTFNSALAYNLLQLDVTNDGASYDPSNETIVTADPTFQLVALLNTLSGLFDNKVSDTTQFYIVASWNTATIGGSFDIGSTTVALDGGGSPPSNPQLNHGELGTYGEIIPFYFPTGQWTTPYDTQTNYGEFAGPVNPIDDPSATFLYELFDVDVSGIGDFQPIHFDLFAYEDGSLTKKVFAPFSHDVSVVPEPATILLMGVGIIGMASIGRLKLFEKS